LLRPAVQTADKSSDGIPMEHVTLNFAEVEFS
jgi:hypothetical protein